LFVQAPSCGDFLFDVSANARQGAGTHALCGCVEDSRVSPQAIDEVQEAARADAAGKYSGHSPRELEQLLCEISDPATRRQIQEALQARITEITSILKHHQESVNPILDKRARPLPGVKKAPAVSDSYAKDKNGGEKLPTSIDKAPTEVIPPGKAYGARTETAVNQRYPRPRYVPPDRFGKQDCEVSTRKSQSRGTKSSVAEHRYDTEPKQLERLMPENRDLSDEEFNGKFDDQRATSHAQSVKERTERINEEQRASLKRLEDAISKLNSVSYKDVANDRLQGMPYPEIANKRGYSAKQIDNIRRTITKQLTKSYGKLPRGF
jgi:hypothetical protein